ncbi:MAG: lactate utilization protein [Anaerolineae bacterium]|nr:lactate utilization protein [Anaerolineae bacterium]
MNSSRDAILNRVHNALRDSARQAMPILPDEPRVPGDANARVAATLAAIERVSGKTRRIQNPIELSSALAELVRAENIRKATLWENQFLRELGIANILSALDVELVSPRADKHTLAQCDLGVTGADAVLPQTGTLALRTTSEQGEVVSLLPRVHLAIFRPTDLCADLREMLTCIKHDAHAVLITGSSRTTDIEKTLALGVHGPKVFHVWSYEG